jgi:sulfite reductase alpha subunit-like flavoprotein
VLTDFYPNDKCKLPLAYLIQLCGKQKPREFSISSMVPGEAHLTMAVTEYETQFKREKVGICSGWLREMSEHTVPVWLKRGTLTLP